MVGAGVLHECLRDERVQEVLAILRTRSGQSHPKLRELIRNDFLETVYADLDAEALPGIVASFARLEGQARHWLAEDQRFEGEARILPSADMRYRGQSFEIGQRIGVFPVVNCVTPAAQYRQVFGSLAVLQIDELHSGEIQ